MGTVARETLRRVSAPDHVEIQQLVTAAYEDRSRLEQDQYADAVRTTLALLDSGRVRVAEPRRGEDSDGRVWTVHAWVKQAILLYFGLCKLETHVVGPFEYLDKIPLKRDWAEAGVRVVPPATARFGAHIEAGAVLMPSYVNIGARVGAGTMVDTWATVGSCAQVGRDVHLSGGVGIGGVLEPPNASPVIIEDGCFLGSRAIVVEGVHLESEVVLGANVVITASTPIIDVTGTEPVERRGRVPARSVVIPGTRTKRFPAGEFAVPCALIIGQRKASTDRRTSLNSALRDFSVAV
ncbi:MAG: 2,3,4,5-tetrahydropyridine-2,6-dicarboxylate N-succinyltransferase [Myxococcales bacterium FL481]|nr:MAG: 2,3,4,5-tetrahydropyridine-2,6-dicarboxylate N-succinyltransferase [Myxococcales bacterium FL481]